MPACDIVSLEQGAKCFDCLSLAEKAALKVWFLAQGLKAFGGPDLTNVNVRRRTIACINCLPDFRVDSMDVLVAQRLALNAGANGTVSVPIAQLRKAVSCSPCGDTPFTYLPDEMYVRCLLNQFIGSGAQ